MNRSLFISLLIIFNIVIDRVSKLFVEAKMNLGQEIELIGHKFILKYVKNEGAFLGMGSDLNPTLRILLLLVLPVVVLAYVTYYILKNKDMDKLSLIAFCCIIGGGIANVFDRLAYGEVTDFFFIDLGGVFRTGIFNVADMSVTFGLLALILSNFLKKKPISNQA
ncbi:MAG: signal peptidase II [Flavobacteriaceae bacterium]|nr:signal peptidase II [Mangrovimonas sp.]MCB0434599.1 signal peptidase II [Mangrovimonas sp.]HPF97094.1 signal peptidase II [Mangrovimonas sp.]HRV54949.1 signal peptidase II [Mangrovimonas sp.]